MPSSTRKKPRVGFGGFFLVGPLKRYGLLPHSGRTILSTIRNRALSHCDHRTILFSATSCLSSGSAPDVALYRHPGFFISLPSAQVLVLFFADRTPPRL